MASEDVSMKSPTPESSINRPSSPKYGGFTRFEIELEFVQALASPAYLQHLATSTASNSSELLSSELSGTNSQSSLAPPTPLLQYGPFIEYLKYLQYWSQPEYAKYLTYPGPTLKNLELLQSERFRREILSPDVGYRLAIEGIRGVENYFAGGR